MNLKLNIEMAFLFRGIHRILRRFLWKKKARVFQIYRRENLSNVSHQIFIYKRKHNNMNIQNHSQMISPLFKFTKLLNTEHLFEGNR